MCDDISSYVLLSRCRLAQLIKLESFIVMIIDDDDLIDLLQLP